MGAEYQVGFKAGYAKAESEFRQLLLSCDLIAKEPELQSHQCTFCGQRFATGKKLGWHVSTQHRGAVRVPTKRRADRTYRCKVCGHTEDAAVKIKHHRKEMHPELPPKPGKKARPGNTNTEQRKTARAFE